MNDKVTQVPTAAKLKCLARELTLRRTFYPKRVEQHRMTQLEADYEIEVMEAMVADYQQRVRDENS